MLYHHLPRHALLVSSSLFFALYPAAQARTQDGAPPPDSASPPVADEALEDDLHDRRRDYSGQIVVSAQGLDYTSLQRFAITASHPIWWMRRGCSSVVEHNLAKVGVEGSNPFTRSNFQHKGSLDL